MKKLFFLFMMMLPLACTEEGIPSDGGSDDGGNEMAECVCPASVRAGKDAVLQWEGFVEGDVLKAVSESGDVYDLIVTYVTSSGMGFTVPVDVPAGRYMLVLDRSQRVELGEMEITAPSMPITGLSVPAKSLAGETVLISGVGYVQGCKILFAGDEEYELAATLTNEGVTVVLPENMPVGTYQVYLLQDNLKWPLKENFVVFEEVVLPEETHQGVLVELRSIYSSNGTDKLQYSWLIETSDPVTLTYAQYSVSGDVVELDCYDSYVSDASGKFVLASDGFEESNDTEIAYIRDGEGNVTASEVLFYRASAPTTLEWSYNSDGLLTSIAGGVLSPCELEYDNAGNLTSYNQIRFAYEDDTLVNNPMAPDVAWAYMVVQEYIYPHRNFPYLLGWYRHSSSCLPTSVSWDSQFGGEVKCDLSYEHDASGYVSKMSWTEGSEQHSIEFIYR